jgi:hypothetical protein
MDATVRRTRRAGGGRRSRVVPMPRRWHQVREDASASRGRWWQESPVTKESAEETVKTIAQGRPVESASTCGDDARVLFSLHTGPRVRRAPGLPCALDHWRDEKFTHHSDAGSAAGGQTRVSFFFLSWLGSTFSVIARHSRSKTASLALAYARPFTSFFARGGNDLDARVGPAHDKLKDCACCRGCLRFTSGYKRWTLTVIATAAPARPPTVQKRKRPWGAGVFDSQLGGSWGSSHYPRGLWGAGKEPREFTKLLSGRCCCPNSKT